MIGRPVKLLMLVLFSTLLLGACEAEESIEDQIGAPAIEDIEVSGDTVTISVDFDSLFASYGVKGTILVQRGEGDTTWLYNAARADEGFLPASTFKICNTLIGLETGVVNTEDTLFTWDGSPRRMKSWEADMTLEEAFHTSCVPCYQEVARKIGTERMNAYLTEFGYGKMVVTDETLDHFWLQGPSRITPNEQMAFLRRLIDGNLAVSSASIDGLREVMLLLETSNYQLFGKTGWSIEGRRNIGWFVGWYETRKQSYLFVTNIEPLGRAVPDDFAAIRHKLTRSVMKKIVQFQTEPTQ